MVNFYSVLLFFTRFYSVLAAGCMVNFYWGLWVKSQVTCNVCSTSRARLENVDVLWQRKTSGGGKIGYIKDLEMKMVDISIVRYENVDTLWWSVKI